MKRGQRLLAGAEMRGGYGAQAECWRGSEGGRKGGKGISGGPSSCTRACSVSGAY
jgi:hypothetical protein